MPRKKFEKVNTTEQLHTAAYVLLKCIGSIQPSKKVNSIRFVELTSVSTIYTGYKDAAARQIYWLGWLMTADEIITSWSIVGPLPIISTSYMPTFAIGKQIGLHAILLYKEHKQKLNISTFRPVRARYQILETCCFPLTLQRKPLKANAIKCSTQCNTPSNVIRIWQNLAEPVQRGTLKKGRTYLESISYVAGKLSLPG